MTAHCARRACSNADFLTRPEWLAHPSTKNEAGDPIVDNSAS